MKGIMDLFGIDPDGIAEQAEELLKMLHELSEMQKLILSNQTKIMNALKIEQEENTDE